MNKIIHQIWLQGWDNLPADIKKYTDSCIKINKNFEHIKWDDQSIRALLEFHGDLDLIRIYDGLKNFASKADLARYLILYYYGGMYYDTDFEFFKPSDVLTGADFVRRKSHYHPKLGYGRISNCVFGARPLHPVFLIILKKLKERCASEAPQCMLDVFCNTTYRTGCNLFYDSVMEYHETYPEDSNYLIIANEQLFPSSVNDDNQTKLKRFKNVAFMNHMHNLSWCPIGRMYKKARAYKWWLLIILIIIILVIWLRYKHKGSTISAQFATP